MLRQMHNSAAFVRLRFTASELLLLVAAAGLVCASIVQFAVAPISSGVMLLAAVAIVALVHERANTRQMVRLLGERLGTAPTLSKLEVAGASDIAMLDHALNRAIQRARVQAHAADAITSERTAPAFEVGEPRMVAVLAVGVRNGEGESFSEQHLESLLRIAKLAQQGDAANLSLRVQSDGVLLVAYGLEKQQPVAASIRQALELVGALSAEAQLRFGLSCGTARLCSGIGDVATAVGAPFEDSARLYRMAAAWHEYHLLAAEPVALLARPFHSQRTTLTLSHATAPALPVYAIDLATPVVAMSA